MRLITLITILNLTGFVFGAEGKAALSKKSLSEVKEIEEIELTTKFNEEIRKQLEKFVKAMPQDEKGEKVTFYGGRFKQELQMNFKSVTTVDDLSVFLEEYNLYESRAWGFLCR